MERADNDMGNLSGWDADREWQEFASRNHPSRRKGPRDWDPAPEDESFDPRELPVASSQPAASFPRLAIALWAGCALGLVLCLLGYFNVFSLPQYAWVTLSLASFLCGALAVFSQAPHEHQDDDDGARL